MREELYIYINDDRKQLDLKTPSGITLSYESNLFNSLDKVNCSRSYTFNLPLTSNNMRILGMPEDIRAIGAKVGDKYNAEFLVNGIDLTPNAEIYISEYNGSYSAVMIWGMVEGLKELQKGKLNINQLESEEEESSISNSLIVTPTAIPNGRDWVENIDYDKPNILFYEAGVPYQTRKKRDGVSSLYAFKVYPLPVIPVLMLLKRINQRFGTAIMIKDDGEYYSEDVIMKGVIPDIRVQLTDSQLMLLTSNLQLPSLGDNDIVIFSQVLNQSHGQYTVNGSGHIKPVTYSDISFIITGNLKLTESSASTATNKPTYLCISRGLASDNVWNNDARIESDYEEVNGEKVYKYEWNLDEALGTSVEIAYTVDSTLNEIYFHFEDEEGNLSNGFSFAITFGKNFINVRPKWGEGTAPHLMDAIYSLPEISCFEFIKSLFYMVGAFPVVGANGNIIPAYYSDIFDNLKNGKVYDWSSKIVNNSDNPKSVDWKVGDFAQRNLYRMKSDDEPREQGNDRYANGEAVVEVNNHLLDDEKTVVTLPFFAPFLAHGKSRVNTGHTMKYWRFDEEGNVTAEQANPIFGKVKITDLGNGWYDKEMLCFNFPDDVDLKALRKMVQNPKVIKEELSLDEYSLKNLSYTTPVYLSQYSSYFAIITIRRLSNGISIAELIKIDI